MDVKEGFLCPICMADLGDVIQLQIHFEERHAKEDPAVIKNLKDFFGKAKQKIKKGYSDVDQLISSESASDFASIFNISGSGGAQALSGDDAAATGNDLNASGFVDPYGSEYDSSFHPVSGIKTAYLEDNRDENILPSVSHTDHFRQERSRRADMLAMDTNKLIIRLEKLLTSLPADPVKRRSHEQSVVPWIPENVVKLCPNCAKSFNLTRRKHHCRLCGSIMCNDCSVYVGFDLAKRLINPATIADFNEDAEDTEDAASAATNKRIDGLVSNLADLTGFAESQSRFRTCSFCLETLIKRDARVTLTTEQTQIVLYYDKLRELMTDGAAMSVEYQDTATRLNAGEPATKHKIDEAKVLRLKLLKMAETVDAVSKRIVLLEPPNPDMDPVSLGSYATLKSRIRMASVNFVKATLVGLPGIPTEEELLKLQENRKAEASKRVEEEKKLSEMAKLKFENSAKKQQQQQQKSPRKAKPVLFDAGFVSSLSHSNYVSSDDPIVQQMCNLREFIGQARSAGRHDDAMLLEENLKDLQEEYQRQRAQLEDNYESYKHIFSANRSDDDDVNPFADATEDELAALESTLHPAAVQVDDSMGRQEELERKNITDGSVDFDDYDQSGKNPFF